MTELANYLSSQEAAKMLGVNVSTIKRWTEEGKLGCVRTPGRHRRFRFEHLTDFLQTHGLNSGRGGFLSAWQGVDPSLRQAILKGDYPSLCDSLVAAAMAGSRRQTVQILQGLETARYALPVVYDQLITPVLQDVGHRWAQGEISVSETHIAAQAIRDGMVRAQALLPLPTEIHGTALCLSLAGELHDMALKMIDHLLELRGFEVLYCGPMTPLFGLDELLQDKRPERLYLSSTVVVDRVTMQNEVDRLAHLCEQGDIRMFVGGQGFDVLQAPPSAERLMTFQQIYTR